VGKQIEADNRWAAHCQLPYHSLLLSKYGLTSCCNRTSLLQSLSAAAEGSWMMVMPLQETDRQRHLFLEPPCLEQGQLTTGIGYCTILEVLQSNR
jgi:hypothetical protein